MEQRILISGDKMSLKHILRIISLVALIILILQIIWQVRKVKGGEKLGKHQVSLNWLVLAVVVVAFGGSFMASDQPAHHHFSAKVSQKAKVKHHTSVKRQTKADAAVKFNANAQLKKGKARVDFIIPQGTKLEIHTADGKTISQAKNTKSQPVKFVCTFTNPGDYQVIGINGKQKSNKKLTVKGEPQKAQPAANSSSQPANNQPANKNSQSTANSNSANQGQDSPKKGYHYEYRTILVPDQ